jgi:Restriction endonuclease
MIVTSSVVEAARQKVDRLEYECEVSGADAVTSSQVDRARIEAEASRAAVQQILGPLPSRILREVHSWVLRARLLLGEASLKSLVPETLLAFCLAVPVFLTALLVCAFGNVRPTEAIVASLILFIASVLVLVIFPRIVSIAEAKAQLDTYKIDATNRQAALVPARMDYATRYAEYSRLRRLWNQSQYLKAAEQKLHELQQRFNDRKNRLLAVNWRSLRGVDFERFLVDVFEALGFTVRTTKTTGDQGVDLLAFKGKLRLAVQAKGYGGSVGNGTGRRCGGDVVVRSAKERALSRSERRLLRFHDPEFEAGDRGTGIVKGQAAFAIVVESVVRVAEIDVLDA